MGEEEEDIKRAMGILGKRKSEAKAAAARVNAAGRRSEESKERMREAQKRRRARERGEKDIDDAS